MRAPTPPTAPLRCLAALFVLVAGCASSGSGGSGHALRVALEDYASHQSFELASASPTDRVAYYSKLRHDASRKIQTDEVMQVVVEGLEDGGFDRHAQEGSAPSAGGAVISRAFEIERDGRVRHWVIGSGSDLAERQDFNACVQQFLQYYNVSASFQAVENERGRAFFDEAGVRRGPEHR